MASRAPTIDGALPTPRTGLIGREAERERARMLLLDKAVPLLTLTGPGGAGKTRLALAIAHDVAPQFAEGAIWVDFAPLAEPRLAPVGLARALGIVPVAGLPIEDQLVRELRTQQALLLLDNCEHLLHAVSDLAAALLHACPAVQLLATSRSRLHHRSEHELLVEPFPLPQTETRAEILADNEAVRLFVERSRAIDPGFALTDANAATVAGICRRLDGLPLAIELAATRTKILSPDALLALMGDRMRILRGGAWDLPPRQQTIRDTIAWSYALLTPNQQALFRRMSVFAGGWMLDAIVAIAGSEDGATDDAIDDLGALVDHSLARRVDTGGDARYAMLETIREFGLAELAVAGEEDLARRSHAGWCRSLVDDLELHSTMHRDAVRMERLLPEQDNLRLALAWFAARGDALSLSIMSAAMSIYWPSVGQFAEARLWLHRAIAQGEGVPLALRARVWHEAAWLAMCQGELDVAGPLRDEALRLARLVGEPYLLAEAMLGSGTQAFWQGDLQRAATLTNDGLRAFQALGDEFASAPAKACAAVIFLGNIALVSSDLRSAGTYCETAIGMARTLGATTELGYALCGLAYARLLDGANRDAVACLLEAVALTWRTGDEAFLARLFWAMAGVATTTGQPAVAARLIGVADALDARTGAALWPADRIVADWCQTRLADVMEPDAQTALRAAGATFSLDRIVAAVRSIAASLLGKERADAIWQSTGAPEPGVTGEDVLAPPATEGAARPATNAIRLTRREQDVLELICHHLTDREIAARLFISPRTVAIHVGNVLAKLGARNRRDAAAIVARTGGEVALVVLPPGATLGIAGGELIVSGLTGREMDVLALLVGGCTDRDIADRLLISRRTVSKHVEAILAKLGVHSRGAAVAEVRGGGSAVVSLDGNGR